MWDKSQAQSVADGSTAIQAGAFFQTNHFHGISHEKFETEWLKLWNENAPKLRQEALEEAISRVKEFNKELVKELEAKLPDAASAAKQPSFQHALYAAHVAFARTGGASLKQLLVDCLVKRAQQKERSVLELALSEALTTAPKITDDQVWSLSLIFWIKRVRHTNFLSNRAAFRRHLAKLISLNERVSKSPNAVLHLEFAGCGVRSVSGSQIGGAFLQFYGGIFCKGFERSRISDNGVPAHLIDDYFMPCLNDPSLMQVKALNEWELEEQLSRQQVPESDRKPIQLLAKQNHMSPAEVVTHCESLCPGFKALNETWESCSYGMFDLTSVGIALAHTNLERHLGEFADLSIWIY